MSGNGQQEQETEGLEGVGRGAGRERCRKGERVGGTDGRKDVRKEGELQDCRRGGGEGARVRGIGKRESEGRRG